MSELKNESVELDMVAVTTGATALGIAIPEGGSEKEIVEALRAGFSKRLEGVPKDDWIECSKCLEFTDDAEELYACPFCGDDGSEGDSEEPTATDAADIDPEDYNAPEEPPTVDLDEEDAPEEQAVDEKPAKAAKPAKKATKAKAAKPAKKAAKPAKKAAKAAEPAKAELVEADEVPGDAIEVDESGEVPMSALLNREKHVIKTAQSNMVKNAYKLGMALKRVSDGDLWKADGFKSFRKFIETTPLSNSYVYGLIKMVSDFSEKEFLEVGRKKLIIVAKADPQDRKALLDSARSSKSKKELAAEAAKLAEARGSSDESSAPPAAATPPAKEGKAAKAPAKEDSITLLAKVGGKPLMLRFLDRKTKKALEVWKQDSYVEIQLSDNVSQMVSIKTNEAGEPVGIVAAFVERPKAAE